MRALCLRTARKARRDGGGVMSGLFAALAFFGFGAGLVAMLGVIVLRLDPDGRLALSGLAMMMLGVAGLLGLVASSLLG